MAAREVRRAEHPVDPLFLDRWSPRAYADEAIGADTLLTILDAAHWAPSSYNFQPWRFVYARRGTPSWDRLLGTLNEFNRGWAQAASALVVILSKTTATPRGQQEAVPNPTHSFDAGAAWAFLALQASLLGWHAHGMAGIDRDLARRTLGVPDDYAIEAAVAIGRLGDKATLPASLQLREVPSQRLQLADVAAEGHCSGLGAA
ncbi:nitroreductase family protein [Bordetella genomosp. 13]|uniref:nitroreductase family protein n=1 Tax=Bordetella genomosp. 13 TaxID=463040 RepID=UPI0011A0B2D9|nr:nitroreductase family protein [Bordetella genomosp. 13]